MLEILLYAIPLGITLSFAAGPVFFVVIQTSITRSKTGAFVLDLGAIVADVIFILVAFFGSQSLIRSLRHNIWVGIASGLAVIIFGVYYIRKSHQGMQFKQAVVVPKKRFLFLKGFLLNFLNVGVLFYWIATTMAIGSLLDHDHDKMLLFYAFTLGTYLVIDLLKIYFANRFKERFKGRKIQMVEKIMGLILIGFGLFIALRNVFL
ncbi:MAG: LysE family transporter [Owenweeksia sp.]